MKDSAIKISDVWKGFRLPNEKNSSLKSAIVNFRSQKRGYTEQKVLRGVSLDIKKGDFFGIVGRNGSGKSTLLKIISDIYKPDRGSVSINGSLTPFIELGVGFNHELTGRENVFLNGALLGFSHDEVEDMYDSIVDFAELEGFMDQKLKNYSSGMQVRLAFSVAIQAKSDILVLDEVLAVGDEAFQRKCDNYFHSIKRDKSKTVILVTHSMDAVRRFCNRAALIVDGEVAEQGSPDKVANAYSNIFIAEAKEGAVDSTVSTSVEKWPIEVAEVRVVQGNKSRSVVEFGKDFSINMKITSSKTYDDVVCAIDLVDSAGRVMLNTSTRQVDRKMNLSRHSIVSLGVQNIFSEGEYYINFAVADRDTNNLLFKQPEIKKFSVIGRQLSKSSLTHPVIEWGVDNE